MLRIATRGSALARWQARRVVELLGDPDHDLVIVTTTGDARTDAPIHQIGGQGVFVKEVQQAVIDGHADVAVHSAKDLPASTPSTLLLAAVPERADVRDALVGSTLAELRHGARVGTGAARRRSQLRRLRPDLEFGELRGNVDTRLAKATQFDAVVVASAALARLGRADAISELLDVDTMIPQVAQGALAVECRVDDEDSLASLRAIDDSKLHREIDAERAYLAALGGGCDLPVGALCTTDSDGRLRLRAFLDTDAGPRRADVTGTDPTTLGRTAADAVRS
jgi:hydroxymethylbilane synthase